MKDHWNYFWAVAKHKYYVLIGCIKYKVSLWQGIIHDLSKYTPTEWTPYVHQFYNKDGSKRSVRDASGAYDPNAQSLDFQRAWLSHQKNYHHWQAWVSIGDGGNLSVLEMPEKYAREMLADWYGAGMAQSKRSDPLPWYLKNRDKMIFHPKTRIFIEDILFR